VAEQLQVKVEGLREFRRDVRRADREVGLELQRALREVAKDVAAEAGSLAPRATGTLAGSYRGTARGASAVVRSRLPYARFIEFGFHPRGGETFVEGTNPIGRAVERQEDRIVDGIGDAVDHAATRLGWH
jgi:bacteriophage HK97-gp10 putative tail-component